jgi:DNA-binding beta-propeller fold protein YncE
MRLAALCVWIGVMLATGSAQAAITHDFSFGGSGTGPGQFVGAPRGIAVNHTTGDVYVADTSGHRIEQFDADGDFIRMWGRGVNQTISGDVCPVNPGDVCGPGVAGGDAGWFSSPQGVAVDNSAGPAAGSVYVQDVGNYRIQRFTAAGDFVLTWGKGVNQTTGGNVCTAVSPDVCQTGSPSGDASAVPPIRTEDGVFSSWLPTSWNGAPSLASNLAVDSSGHVYVGEPKFVDPAEIPGERGAFSGLYSRVQKFDSSGALLAQIAAPAEDKRLERGIRGSMEGLVLNAAGDVYVAFLAEGGLKLFPQSEFSATGSPASWELTIAPGTTRRNPAVDLHNQFVLGTGDADLCGDGGGTAVYEYHPSGEQVDCTPLDSPAVASVGAIATAPGRKLYLSDAAAGTIHLFQTPTAALPDVGAQSAGEITSIKAVLKTEIAANLDDTTFRLEYGTSPCSTIACDSTAPSASIGAAFAPRPVSAQLTGLAPATTYHYRFVATNGVGSEAGSDRSFTTYAEPTFEPDCANNLARQQTGAALLLDCRAYELVSASDQGGYNVASDLVPGEAPFGGYPAASGKALYAVHNGGIPGTGNPTNRGPDPYLAVRDADAGRWETRYVGIPADAPSAAPFSSTLEEADPGLASFAFGGPELCDPCFPDGSVGIPVRLPDGRLVQGMDGSIDVPQPISAGEVRKALSADGEHLIFASEQQFEPGANPGNGNVTVYERDLVTGTTQVVSTLPSGQAIANGAGVVALDVSADGSRVLIGEVVSTDAGGNEHLDLYMHLDGSSRSIPVAQTANGVLYAGMTADGSQVFFTSRDQFADDTDASADLFRATIGATATVERVSIGAGADGDTDDCDPAGNSYNRFDWNAIPGSTADCSVVAVGGGGGVATDSGAVYFLSPERLDGAGIAGAPNLFLARPGESPRFVATLDSSLDGPQPPPYRYRLEGSFGPFSKVIGIGVHRSSGHVYVFDGPNVGAKTIEKFDAGGDPVKFTAGSGAGTNQLTGMDAPTGAFAPFLIARGSLAVDQVSGRFYVPDYNHNVVDVFAPSGEYDSQIAVSTPTAVALHPVSGNVYVTRRTANAVSVFTPAGVLVTSFPVVTQPLGIAVDGASRVYVVNSTQTAVYDASGAFLEVLHPAQSTGVTVDPANDDVFVNGGTRFLQFDATGEPVGGGDGDGGPAGVGELANSVEIALGAQETIYTSNGSTSVAIFPRSLKPTNFVDNPLALDSVGDPERRNMADFQVTPSGEHAAFASARSLTGFDSAGQREVFRYEVTGDELRCASCSVTGQPPAGSSTLAANGLSLTDDGRLFFNTAEPLVLRDTNRRKDAYEWSEQRVELVSTGQSPFDSGLLSVSADGTDAFFFTRDTLTADDGNGNLTKLYTARAGGGFFRIPPPPPCAASDECHGPGSQPAPPVGIGTLKGEGGNLPSVRKCGRGKVKRRGKCVKPKKPRRRQGRRAGRHGGAP